jgi:hypothetical protein
VSILNTYKHAQYAMKALNLAERAIEMSEPPEEERTILDEIEVEGRHLIERIQELIREGNARRLIIRKSDGKYLLEIPLTTGVVAGGVFALATPPLAILTALVGLISDFKIQIVHEETGEEPPKK